MIYLVRRCFGYRVTYLCILYLYISYTCGGFSFSLLYRSLSPVLKLNLCPEVNFPVNVFLRPFIPASKGLSGISLTLSLISHAHVHAPSSCVCTWTGRYRCAHHRSLHLWEAGVRFLFNSFFPRH